ncbi:MAG: hypothetical protein WA979_00380 [Pacificimonas sp.]
MNEIVSIALVSAALMCGLWGIVDSALRRWAQVKEKQIEMASGHHAERDVRRDDLVRDLSVRVQVLERILTDRGTHLADEIETLRAIETPRAADRQKEIN